MCTMSCARPLSLSRVCTDIENIGACGCIYLPVGGSISVCYVQFRQRAKAPAAQDERLLDDCD